MKKSLLIKLSTLALSVCSFLCIGTACKEDEPQTTYHTVTWQNYDGNVLETDENVKSGTMPTYDSEAPTRANDAQYTYEFSGWSPEITTVAGDVVYVAQFASVVNEYAVLWKNYDGSILETDENVAYGTTPAYNGETPTKAGDAQYTYTFDGWDKIVDTVKGDAVYTAKFVGVVNKYTIIWKDYDGSVLETDTNVAYGTVPTYNGVTPARNRAEYTYTFSGWDKEVVAVTGDITYTAQYTQELSKYTVIWKNYDGTVLETDTGLAYQAIPEYNATIPTRTKDAQYTYTFSGWSPIVSKITDDIVYKAQYSTTINKYTVTWKNYDGTLLETDTEVPYGEMPIYNGNTPTREKDAQYTYTFNGWTANVSKVTGDVVYTAKYSTTVNKYTVTWKNYDDSILETDTNVEYGAKPIYNAATPTRDNSGLSYGYQFSGWSPAVSTVTEDCVYIAQFVEEQLSRYTVNYDANGGTGAPSTQIKYKSSNLKLSSTVPTREGYTFIGWNNLYEETVYQAGDTFTSNFNVTMFAMWAETCDGCDGKGEITSSWSCGTCRGSGYARECPNCRITVPFSKCNVCNSTYLISVKCGFCGGEGSGTDTSKCSDCQGLTYIKPVAPTTQSIEARSITLTKINGYEYKIEGGEWQESNIFENLKYSTTYTFYQRKATGDRTPFGVTSAALTVKTKDTTFFYITYELADGKNNDSNPASYYSTGSNITLKAPTKEHYDFAGWLYNGDIVTEINASWCSDITLTATWTPTKYVITYELDGGASENVLFYTIETETFTLIVPQKEGYTFLGWTGANSETVSLTVTIPKGSYGELSYTAHWSINQYTISFVANNGQVFDSITQDYNTAITLPKPTWTERSFVGWFDESLNEQFTRETMPAENVTLYGKWINYEVFLCVDNLTGLSVNGDATDGATYNVSAIDTDNNPVKVTAQLLSGSQTEGTSITVRFLANGLYGVYAMQMVSDIKVYGMPTIQYDTQKDYINASDSLVASLFTATATDTYGEQLPVNVSIKETEYSAGDTITIILSATDITGNTTVIEIENVKYYGTPTIVRDDTITEIKESDAIGNQLFGVSATDSFGETLTVTTVKESGTFAGGYTITIKSSATDSKGNTAYITYDVQVYALPTITNAAETNFKEGEEITLSTLGVVAKDSFGNVLENVALSLTDGTNAAGNTLTYLVTATDHLGNVNTKTISVKVYGTPTITYNENKTAIKATDKISASLFSATAKDSFANDLTVTTTLESGEIKGGSRITVKLVATDRVGNACSIIIDEIKVYEQDDIVLTYNAALSNNIKKTSCGEEFNAIATDTFGEACTITIQPASGYSLTGGTTINLYLVATDKAGNTYTSELLTEKNVYDTPTVIYAREYDYILANDNPYLLFTVKDSFGADRLFDLEVVSGSLQELGVIVYRITAEDKMGNELDCTYSLYVTEYDENGFLVCEQDGVITLVDYSSTNDIVVPDGVQSIAKELFANDTNIKSIVLPDSLEQIGENEFAGCSELISIVIPNGISTIGKYAFYNCSNLISVEIPDNVLSIGENCFENCIGLKSIIIGGGVTSISNNAFYNCNSLNNVVIGKGVTNIGENAFGECSSLTEITIPDSVTSIGIGAFYNSTSLTSITLPFVGATKDGSSYTHFGYIFGASSYDYNNSYVPTSLRQVTITSATSISSRAFYNCKNLTSVAISDSVMSIDDEAFYGCSSLTSMTLPFVASYFGEFFGYTTNKTTANKVGAIYQRVEYWGTNNQNTTYYYYYIPKTLRSVTINGGKIPYAAFNNCSMLESVTIGEGVTSISYQAFYGCDSLTSITFKDTSTWYRTGDYTNWKNKTDGTSTSVTNSSTNATYFKSTTYYSNYYWYKL